MDVIKKEEFESAGAHAPEEIEEFKVIGDLTESKFDELMADMEDPVKAQKHLAVQIKNFLDQRIKTELKEKQLLSDHTRRWVKVFNEILDKIQKNIYGDKSISINYHKVTHSQLAMRMREAEEPAA